MDINKLIKEKHALLEKLRGVDRLLADNTKDMTFQQWEDNVEKKDSMDHGLIDEYEMLTQETYYADQELWMIMDEIEGSVGAEILTRARADKFLKKLKNMNIGRLIIT